MKSAWQCLLLSAAFTVAALAQQPSSDSAAATAPSTRDDIQRLFTAMHVQEQIRTTMEMMMTQQRQMIGDMMRKRNRHVTDEQIDEVGESAQDFLKSFPLEQMVDDMIPVYQKHLTKTDVDAMVAFYSSPTGQKLLREQPGMAAESMQAVSVRVQRALKDAMDRADRKAADQKSKDEAEHAKPAVPPEQRKN